MAVQGELPKDPSDTMGYKGGKIMDGRCGKTSQKKHCGVKILFTHLLKLLLTVPHTQSKP